MAVPLARGFVEISADDRPADERIRKIRANLTELARKTTSVPVDLADKQLTLKMARINDSLRCLDRKVQPEISMRGIEKAELQVLALDASLDRLDRKDVSVDVDVSGATQNLAGLGATLGKLSNVAIPALVGGLTALAPTIITVGFGLAGLGAAAVGTLKPLSDAASKAGGLSANLGSLNADQRHAAEGLLSLGDAFHRFSASLAPQIFRAFNTRLRIARELMGSLQPVAQATGNALNALLSRVEDTFRSGQWQSFFTWMKTQAGPDIKLLGDAFINLINTCRG